tara:strand:+ start:732 stop:1145 length:414 start_codon:yes stop_codon:yes gene_type:complete
MENFNQKEVFATMVRIYYEDTDSGGVVYYANYLKYYERARTEYLRVYNFNQSILKKEKHLVFAVAEINVNYIKPLFLDDVIKVTCAIEKISKTSINFVQKIINQDDIDISSAFCKIVCLNENFKPTKIPDVIADKIV